MGGVKLYQFLYTFLAMNIILVGMMGTGKTAVGKELAERLGWFFFDTDELIEETAKMSISEIFKNSGEERFREYEREVVRKLAQADKSVIGTGGGTLMNPENMAALKKNGFLVWLKARPKTILQRIRELHSRPLLDPQDPEGSLTNLLARRETAYGASQVCIETDALTVDQVVEHTIEQLNNNKVTS